MIRIAALVRQATAADTAALLPLVERYWKFENIPSFQPERVAAQLGRLLRAPNLGGGWIAVSNGEVVGYLLAVYVFSLEHFGVTAELDELFVLPLYRGKGVGDALLRAAECEFARIGCTNISLQLARDNRTARAFYHHHGYSERSGYDLLDKNCMMANNL